MPILDRSSLSAVGSTAVSVAVCRAAESARPDRWFFDPLAVYLVEHAVDSLPPVRPGLVAWISARTRFLDAVTMEAMEDGVRQIVIVAAGLDARAFRLPLPADAVVFEVDRSDIFHVKDELLEESGLTPRSRRHPVIADILDPGWLPLLAAGGWDSRESTLWILEGLLIYLAPSQRVQLLAQLAGAGDRGRLGATASTAKGPMPHPLWQPAPDGDPETWMASAGWSATTQTMAEASAAFGRPLPATRWTNAWRLVSATQSDA
ncbi:MAG TPA: SAM-dependent methyltransferase [Acidimicrobiales bacterium]|jgi:methyltransferase (TIGR00027 family)|nr:SAM-dependent methyltransferase [Acidimicrobiales bacterium]